MPPIPIYSHSPINAEGVTPQTAAETSPNARAAPPTTTTSAAAAPTSPAQAQPGATPAIPARSILPQPTPTQPLAGASSHGPPPPQPGAVPTATAAPPFPPQMSIPAPASNMAQRGTSTAFFPAAQPSPLEHPPGYRQDSNAGELNRYQRAAQDALEEEEEEEMWRRRRGRSIGEGADGVWEGAKRAVAMAGEKLAAAEGEVWRRINKE